MPKTRDLGINVIPFTMPGGSVERILENCGCTNAQASINKPQCPDSRPQCSPPSAPPPRVDSDGRYAEFGSSLTPDVILQLKHHLQDRIGTGMSL